MLDHSVREVHAKQHSFSVLLSLSCDVLQLFDWIYIGEVGAHDGDWEHVTLRLTPDAQQVLGIYYSAHRYSPETVLCIYHDAFWQPQACD